MKNQDVAFAGHRAFNFLRQEFDGQFKGFRFDGVSQVDNIRGVDKDLLDSMLLHIVPGGFYHQFADFLAPRVLRRAGVEHKRVRAVRDGFLCGTEQHFLAAHPDMRTK